MSYRDHAYFAVQALKAQAYPSDLFEKRATRDVRVPLSDDDPEMNNGWRNIQIPPTDDPAWFIIDESSDKKTVWARPLSERAID